jgi:hypothetical protein
MFEKRPLHRCEICFTARPVNEVREMTKLLGNEVVEQEAAPGGREFD